MSVTREFSDIIDKFRSYEWRLNNLFYIKNKAGEVVKYTPNPVQRQLIDNRHRRNIIPKARQHGITTGVAIHFLNSVLTTPHQRAAIIAHRESDAYRIFEQKIKFPFQNIPEHFKILLPSAVKITANVLELDNGSTITADTMVRSDTLNFLHVSELGKMAAWYPIKAEEVKTGALPAAERGEIFIESTMEGNVGLMADLCQTARELHYKGVELTDKDYKFFFFGWHDNPEYVLHSYVEPSPSDVEYFNSLASDGIVLSTEQQNWYLKERDVLGDKMRQEYPATYDESIALSLEGVFFSAEMSSMHRERRICSIPHDIHAPVYAAMDLGFNDATSVCVFQVVGREIRIINSYEFSCSDIGHYASWLSGLPYEIATVFLPHDGNSKSLQTGRSIADILRGDYRFKVDTMERDRHEYLQIDLAKKYFPRVWIDKNCERLIECLSCFSREYNKRYNVWMGTSRHDEYSDGAKAFLYTMKAIAKLYTNDGKEFSKDELLSMKYRRRYV